MDEFWKTIPLFIPSWLIMTLAYLAAAEALVLAVYLMYTHDHLIFHPADVGIIGTAALLYGVNYTLITAVSYYERSVAMSRISTAFLLAALVVIFGRYLLAIGKERFNETKEENCIDCT